MRIQSDLAIVCYNGFNPCHDVHAVPVVSIPVNDFVVIAHLPLEGSGHKQRLIAAFGRGDRVDAVQDGLCLFYGIVDNEHYIKEVLREVWAFVKGERTVQQQHSSVSVVVLDCYHSLFIVLSRAASCGAGAACDKHKYWLICKFIIFFSKKTFFGFFFR